MKLILLGDSLVAFGDWQRLLPDRRTMNLGLAGETVRELRQRLDRLAGRLGEAACFLVMIGTNDVAMEEYGFLPTYGEIIATLRQRHPAAVVLVSSLLPLRLPWLAPDAIPRLNERLRSLARELGAGYVDGHAAFAASGKADSLFLDDGVHLSDQGYATWAAAIRPHLPAFR